MNSQTYIPTNALQPFIRQYLIIESDEEITNKILPGTSVTIAFRYKGQINYVADDSFDKLPATMVSGLRTSVRLINYQPDSAAIIVTFKENGASTFFKTPLHEMFEKSVSLDNFITRQETEIIEEQLCEAKNNELRIAILEQFFLSRLCNRKPDVLISAALQTIKAANGFIKMKALANSLYISQDAFEKRFRKTIGTSPKQFSSIIRIRSIINKKPTVQALSHIAFDAGYCDQSHFSKDFKMFTGQTPANFFSSSQLFW